LRFRNFFDGHFFLTSFKRLKTLTSTYKRLNLSAMNRRLNPLLLVLCSALLAGSACKKQATHASGNQQDLIQQARILIDSLSTHGHPVNYRAAQLKTIRWDLATLQEFSTGPAIIVPITYENQLYIRSPITGVRLLDLSQLTKLIVFLRADHPHTYQINTLIPDSISLSNPEKFSGIILTEDWFGNSLLKPYLISPSSRPGDQPDELAIIQSCITIDGYNYSADDPDDGEAWSETTCTTYGIESPDGGVTLGGGDASAGAGGGGSGVGEFSVAPPTNQIGNYPDYIKCFTNVGGSDHTYTVTLAVEQPSPGTRTPWVSSGNGSSGSSASGNPVSAGHTFLILTETTANGTTTRNVGFYPQGVISPLYPSDQGVLNNDQATGYNISLTITMTNAQFFTILNFLGQGNNTGYLYNLNSNNCTTFALNALASAGINIATTKGTWLDGTGDDPGDLGEDIRDMQLPANTTRNTLGNPHPNLGSCE
jgi:hypothetical protein